MAKIAWHTDIVVDGQGMNVKITTSRSGCATMRLMPDVPGAKAKKAATRFTKAVGKRDACSLSAMKRAIGAAVRDTGARWNRWHHETY